MISYEKIKAGDVLHDVHRYKMGNTNISTLGHWTVEVIEMTPGGAIVRWNGNRPEFWSRHRLSKLRRKPPAPEKLRSPFDR